MSDSPKNRFLRDGGSRSQWCEPGSYEALSQLQAHCDRLNENAGSQMMWIVTGKAPYRTVTPVPRPKQPQADTVDRVRPENVDKLNRALRKYGAQFRYDPHGRPFDLKPGQDDPTAPEALS